MAKVYKKKICSRCGVEKNTTNFYLSRSILYASDGIMPICKTCLDEVYNTHYEKIGDEREALYLTCNMLDIYFEHKIFDSALETKRKKNVMSEYVRRVNHKASFQNLLVTSIDSEDLYAHESEKSNDEIEKNKTIKIDNVSEEMIARWGRNLSETDYFSLEIYYQELVQAYESKTPTQRWLYQDIAKCRVEGERCLKKGDSKGYTNMVNTALKLMTDSNIKPNQEIDLGEEGLDSWGAWVREIENNEPVGEASEEFKDVDGIREYIEKWFIKPFARVLSLANDEDELDEELNKSVKESLKEEPKQKTAKKKTTKKMVSKNGR